MSDGKKVKRWETISIDTKIPGVKLDVDSIPRVVVVSAEAHDRIVAELKAEVARQAKVIDKLKERLTSWISETHPNDEHLRNMCLMVEERELEAIEKDMK